MSDIRFWHRIQLPDGSYTNGMVHHGPDGGDWPTTRFGMPKDLTDKRVIDIGCWDGFFSFEAEKRGAKSVLATDCTKDDGGNWAGTKGFEYAKEKLNSNVQFQYYNIEEYPEDIYFQYDLVMCYGVLYHLKSPLLAIENLFKITAPGGICLLETTISKSTDKAVLEYRPRYANDPTNYFYPTTKWIELAALESGFKTTKEHYNDGSRVTFILGK